MAVVNYNHKTVPLTILGGLFQIMGGRSGVVGFEVKLYFFFIKCMLIYVIDIVKTNVLFSILHL